MKCKRFVGSKWGRTLQVFRSGNKLNLEELATFGKERKVVRGVVWVEECMSWDFGRLPNAESYIHVSGWLVCETRLEDHQQDSSESGCKLRERPAWDTFGIVVGGRDSLGSVVRLQVSRNIC